MSKRVPVLTAALILSCLPAVRCAYLNTFYNARTAYNSARREHVKLAREKPDSAETLPTTISDKYDRAITKSLKVLETYPKSKKWHDDAIYLMGRAAFYKGEFASAVRRLRRLQREFPESPYIPESYLYLGRAHLGNDNLIKAEETFRLIIEKHPELNANEEVSMLLAQVAIKREGKAQAIELLEQTLTSVNAPDKKMDILLRIARLYMDLRQYEKAISVLDKSPRKKNFPEHLYRTDYALLSCYAELGRYAEALNLANAMLKNRQYVTHYPEVQLKKAKVLKAAGKVDDAVDAFEQVTKNTTCGPDIQGEAWLELAFIYQSDRGDFEKARECYDKAVSLLTDKDLRQTAQIRKAAIDELEGYRRRLRDEITATDTTDTTDTTTAVDIDTTSPVRIVRYKMGEIFWLNLQEPDSALHHFNAVGDDSIASDTLQTQALFARAWISLHMKKDSSAADSLFGIIIDECPATLYAKRSQAEMGLAVTVETREDSAHAAFLEAEKLYFEDNDALAASKAYLRVAKAYPEEVGAQSFYAAAWLCDNVLQKNVTARKLYRTVCDSFPQSDLCLKEAKPRLQIVEDTLEAIRARKQSGSKGEGKETKRQKRVARNEGGEEETATVSDTSDIFYDRDEEQQAEQEVFPGQIQVQQPDSSEIRRIEAAQGQKGRIVAPETKVAPQQMAPPAVPPAGSSQETEENE